MKLMLGWPWHEAERYARDRGWTARLSSSGVEFRTVEGERVINCRGQGESDMALVAGAVLMADEIVRGPLPVSFEVSEIASIRVRPSSL